MILFWQFDEISSLKLRIDEAISNIHSELLSVALI